MSRWRRTVPSARLNDVAPSPLMFACPLFCLVLRCSAGAAYPIILVGRYLPVGLNSWKLKLEVERSNPGSLEQFLH